MAKILTYTMLIIGVTFLMEMAGMGVANDLANYFGVGVSSLAFGVIVGILTIWGAGAITATFFGRTIPESTAISALCIAIATYSITCIFSISETLRNNCASGAACQPMIQIIYWFLVLFNAGYLIAIIQWWRGNDIA